jgi:acetyl esterase/lipase
LGCSKVLVAVAEKDLLRDRGLLYCEALKKCGWGGAVETMEAEGEGHVFHLFNPTSGIKKYELHLKEWGSLVVT